MRRIALAVFGLLAVTIASASTVVACRCSEGLVGDASKSAASIFMGEVIEVGEPREVTIGAKTQQLYVTKFFVWERWKGPKSLEAKVLTEMPFHWGLPQMRVGSVYLVYAFTVSTREGSSSEIEGLVTHCSPTTSYSRFALTQVFELDRIFKPKSIQRAYLFAPLQQPKKSCLLCCID